MATGVNRFSGTRGNLTSGSSDLPPLLQRFMGGFGGQYMPQQWSAGNHLWQSLYGANMPERTGGGDNGGGRGPNFGGGLEKAANNAIQTFNFRRNYAEGGLVGAPTAGSQGAPAQAQPGQLQAMAQQVIQSNPQVVQQLQQAIMQALQSGAVTPQQLQMAIQMAKAAAQNPELYPRLRQMAIQSGLAQEDELPPQYDQGIVFAILLAGEAAMQGMQGGGPVTGRAQGGNYAEGGSIPQSRSPTGDKSGKADDIKINVSGGEYVIPKHIVAAKGTEFFDRMVEQYDPNNPESKVNKPK